MSVFIMPQFVSDLQSHGDAHFAKRVLQKALSAEGTFLTDKNDHRYDGIAGAWIRYVSQGSTAYRMIYLRFGENVYLFRAGEHSVELNLASPCEESIATALPVASAPSELAAAVAAYERVSMISATVINRFRRNRPNPEISRAIYSRRNLPHKDIWIVSPFINSSILSTTSPFGRFLFAQVEDGASISIVTAPPKDKNIQWMETLSERKIGVFVYPRLHTKLYCFVLDQNRRYERGLPSQDKLDSLILIGSANLTEAGLALGDCRCNEELCYSVPEIEMEHVETYMTELLLHAYDMPQVRSFSARNQWQKMENSKW